MSATPDPAVAKNRVKKLLDEAHVIKPKNGNGRADDDEFGDVTTAAAIMAEPEQEAAYCVPERVPAGLVVMGGRPKAKKSWWLLQLGIAKATGGKFLGKESPGCPVLLLQLEDNKRRGRKRFAFFGINEPNQAPANLHICYKWSSGLEGIAKLHRWMELHHDTKLIGIDVLQRMRGPKDRGVSVYDADYEYMGLLHALTTKYPGLTIVVIHHIKKGTVLDPVEAINGSFGIAGAADGYIILRRGDDNRWIAHIDGRDWELWDHDFMWEFRQGEGWVQLGLYCEDLTDRQSELLKMSRDQGSITPSDVARRYNISRASAMEALKGLVAKGDMYNSGGKYKPSVVTIP